MFRVRAPELTGRGGWLNTSEPLSLTRLRGKVVLLDFWTFCCANCLHVLDDPDLDLWRQYAVRAWPTLVVIDPEGYVVTQAAGEGQTAALDRIIGELVATHDAKGTLHRGAGPYTPPVP